MIAPRIRARQERRIRRQGVSGPNRFLGERSLLDTLNRVPVRCKSDLRGCVGPMFRKGDMHG